MIKYPTNKREIYTRPMLNICMPINTGSQIKAMSIPARTNLAFLFTFVILKIWSNCNNNNMAVIITTSIGNNNPYPIEMEEMKLYFFIIIFPGPLENGSHR